MKKRNRSQICPKCKSKDISPDLSAKVFSTLDRCKCNKCGYKGTFFPIIEKIGKSKLK